MLAQTILIVKDDRSFGQLLVHLVVKKTPHQPVLISTGSEAVKIYRKINPRLLLLDYHLPDMNGIVLYDQLCALPEASTCPAIIVSAELPENKLEQQLKERDIIGFDTTFDMDDLVRTIEMLLT